ncbi:MAG: transcription termination/antitermination factor NusG [Candidatus Hydrogenedentes bacterium]|nr:transcription termination/antitermination factor NusG [Candidatus Hydrogenedentota bacterium]
MNEENTFSSGGQKRWYAVHAHSGHENKVRESLLRGAEQRGLSSKIEEVLVPSEEVSEIKSGKRRVSNRKFFPGYVLVRMELTDETWFLVKETPSVTGFIGAGRKPVALTDEEVANIIEQTRADSTKPKPKVSFEQGEVIKITEGPFAGFLGTVDEVNPERGRLKVMVEIFERLTSVELEFWQVERT